MALEVAYLGMWESPFWVGDEDKGSMRRIGFDARTTINRHDFEVSWQDKLLRGGVVVSNEIELILDVEAIHLGDLEKTGAIRNDRPPPTPAHRHAAECCDSRRATVRRCSSACAADLKFAWA